MPETAAEASARLAGGDARSSLFVRYGVLLAAALLCAVVAVGGATWWWSGNPAADPVVSASPGSTLKSAFGSKRISIAMLPLATLGGAATDDYFADGLTEDIIAALGRFSELAVLSPKAVFPFKGKVLRPEELGRELKVRYLAEGSIRRSPERIRIAVRLTDASTGSLLWADQYDAEPESIFAIQDSITRQITGALAVRLTTVEQARVMAKPPNSLEAYDLVLRGRDFLSRVTRSSTSNARAAFERAVELDPNYAAAYVGLGRVDLTAVALGWTPDPAGALRRAESLARKAIGIDEFNPAAHVLLGRAYARLGEYDRALDALKRALALNPSDPDSYAGRGDALLWTGDIDGAIKALETALLLDPENSRPRIFSIWARPIFLPDGVWTPSARSSAPLRETTARFSSWRCWRRCMRMRDARTNPTARSPKCDAAARFSTWRASGRCFAIRSTGRRSSRRCRRPGFSTCPGRVATGFPKRTCAHRQESAEHIRFQEIAVVAPIIDHDGNF